MSVLNSISDKANSASNFVFDPFNADIRPKFDPPDFKDGFVIQEILENGNGVKVALVGNWMPKIPFKFGGEQRFKKEFYSGYSEPTMQVFGPSESDITINGTFKDKRFRDKKFKNVSTEIQQLIDSIRIRGSIVKITLGEFVRYALISKTDFSLERLSKIDYSITFSVIGINKPKNAVFIQRKNDVPFEINTQLIADAAKIQSQMLPANGLIDQNLFNQITRLTNEVASAIAGVTGFVDNIFRNINDLKTAVNRIKGLIKFAQQKLNRYKRLVGGITSFDPVVSVNGRYDRAKFQSRAIGFASILSGYLERLRARFADITSTIPLARMIVKQGDSLQKIAVKYYGSADNWKKIYDYNNLTSTDLTIGRLLEIPRL